MLTRISSALALCAALAAIAPAASAQNVVGNAAAGKAKANMCVGCHAVPGYRTAYPKVYHVPKIGGQQQAYIIAALKEYRSGERWHPSMRAIAGSLTDQDIADLAAYFGGHKQ
ncbi:MAG TPA: c-type cytochrome [Burkholderiales bacterium]|nr:c-type cytochrome [Burkholderiales bacterium]